MAENPPDGEPNDDEDVAEGSGAPEGGYPDECRVADLRHWLGMTERSIRNLLARAGAPVPLRPRFYNTEEVLNFLQASSAKARKGDGTLGATAMDKAKYEKILEEIALLRQKKSRLAGSLVDRKELNYKLGEVAERQRGLFLARIVREAPGKMADMDLAQRREYLEKAGDEFFAEMKTLLDFYENDPR